MRQKTREAIQNRRRVLAAMSDGQNHIAKDIADKLGMTYNGVGAVLRFLKRDGFAESAVQRKRHGAREWWLTLEGMAEAPKPAPEVDHSQTAAINAYLAKIPNRRPFPRFAL